MKCTANVNRFHQLMESDSIPMGWQCTQKDKTHNTHTHSERERVREGGKKGGREGEKEIIISQNTNTLQLMMHQ